MGGEDTQTLWAGKNNLEVRALSGIGDAKTLGFFLAP